VNVGGCECFAGDYITLFPVPEGSVPEQLDWKLLPGNMHAFFFLHPRTSLFILFYFATFSSP
jgi:hypothetical protein